MLKTHASHWNLERLDVFEVRLSSNFAPKPQKVSKLVAAVEHQIAVNPSVFHKFLSFLRADPSLVYIADAMSDLYRKCSSITRCFVAKPALTWNSTL